MPIGPFTVGRDSVYLTKVIDHPADYYLVECYDLTTTTQHWSARIYLDGQLKNGKGTRLLDPNGLLGQSLNQILSDPRIPDGSQIRAAFQAKGFQFPLQPPAQAYSFPQSAQFPQPPPAQAIQQHSQSPMLTPQDVNYLTTWLEAKKRGMENFLSSGCTGKVHEYGYGEYQNSQQEYAQSFIDTATEALRLIEQYGICCSLNELDKLRVKFWGCSIGRENPCFHYEPLFYNFIKDTIFRGSVADMLLTNISTLQALFASQGSLVARTPTF